VAEPKSRDIALAIVCERGRYLVNRRLSDGPLRGLWEFPGGKIQAGESPDQAAVRECAEEVGIAVEAVSRLDTVTYAYDDVRVRLHPVLCALRSGSAHANDPAIGEIRWVRPQELSALPMPPANRSIVESLVKSA
jgi:mutator protein MutT